MLRQIFAVGSLLLLAAPTLASDGAIEINQAKALAGSVTPGDAPGFPVTLTLPGRYVLTGNLNVTTAANGIFVQAAQATIDLGGFEISGPVVCNGFKASVSCTGSGGAGILGTVNTRVHDGAISGFGVGFSSNGSGNGVVVERVVARRNAGSGIFVGQGSRVVDSIAELNFNDGFQASGAQLRGCISRGNRERGVLAVGFTTVLASTISSNGGRGIDASDGAIVRDNVIASNGGIGVFVSSSNPSADVGSVIAGNLVHANAADGIAVWGGALIADNTATGNSAAGIAALAASSVQRNIVRQNVGVGIYLFPEMGGTAAAYGGNVISANGGGTVVNGVDLGGNSCNGATTCP